LPAHGQGDDSTRAEPKPAHREVYAKLLTKQSDLTRRMHAGGYL
jgi:hypothetical protein